MDHETLHLLRGARETGLLDALLDEADTAGEAAAAADVDERAAALTVDALLDEGFLTRVGDVRGGVAPASGSDSRGGSGDAVEHRSTSARSQAREDPVEPTNRLLGFLAVADLRSVGELPDALDAVDALAALPETMSTGEPPQGGDLDHRLGARAAVEEATVRAAVTAAVRAAPEAQRVLDVEGAPGRFATEFAVRGYDVTLADHPDAVDAATPLLACEPVETVTVAADDPLPDGFDLVVAVDATRPRTHDANRAFVARLADAVADGGTVVLLDRLWARSGDAVPAAIESFARDGGGVYRASDVATWFEAAGLTAPEVEDVPGTELVAVVGRPA